ncbi:MAG: fatty acid--CoA ligase, partial [Albidovulum sp.]|uniref:AMP-binding enzyme n=1 Tax=Albidovulum sp. TaxID=1872424 RepID=UPI003C8C9667
GEWVSSLELENLASRVEGVAEAAAIGVPDPKWGERPLLVVACTEAPEAIVTALRAAFARAVADGSLSKWAAPDRIEIVEALPKTSVGKLDKKALRNRFC